jgi:hypothetical protein
MASTVFILGAGSSKEIGIPTGGELKALIADLLDIHFDDFGGQPRGDRLIGEAIRLSAQQQGSRDANPYFHAARRITDGMPLASSIDEFINVHRNDKNVELCGKLAIVKSILDAERGSTFHLDPRRPGIRLNQAAVAATWFNSFWQFFAEDCPIERLERRAESVAFIVFNYDRCIEHFLLHALQTYYGLPQNDAARIVSRITIFHPYGSVGALPWQTVPNQAASVGFGDEVGARHLLELAAQVKTFTEGTDPDSSEIVRIRDLINSVGRIVFLGFAYHRQNLDLLWPDHAPAHPASHCYGTAHGISANDVSVIIYELAQKSGLPRGQIDLQNKLKCRELFHEYGRSLSLL